MIPPELNGWSGKHYFSASELVKLPGMPHKATDLKKLAKQQNWRSRPYAETPEFYFGDFPQETKDYFLRKQAQNQFGGAQAK